MLFVNKKTNNLVIVNDDSMIKDYLTNPNFRVARDADFKETDHPRDEGGKFTSGGGDSGHHDIEPYEKTSGKEETVSLVNKTSGKEMVVTKAAYEKNKESYKSKGFSSSSGKKEAKSNSETKPHWTVTYENSAGKVYTENIFKQSDIDDIAQTGTLVEVQSKNGAKQYNR
jgi:hypothetical protein